MTADRHRHRRRDRGPLRRSPIGQIVRTRRGRRAARAAIVAGLVGFTGLWAVVRGDRTAAADLAVTLKLQQHASPRLDRLLAAASWPGFPPQSRIVPPAIVGAAWLGGRRTEARYMLAAWGAALLSSASKWTVRRPRPLPPRVRVALAPLGGSSFPSGHVLTYVGWYGFLAHLAAIHLDDPRLRRATVAALLTLVALVGPSRIEQGHHWATDVLASYLLGLAYLLAVVELYGRAVEPKETGIRAPVAALDRAVPG